MRRVVLNYPYLVIIWFGFEVEIEWTSARVSSEAFFVP